MQKYVNFLKTVPLFQKMTEEDLLQALEAMHAVTRTCAKGEIILHAGQKNVPLALVLTGRVMIESNDLWGHRAILSTIGAKDVFAETYALLKDEPMLVDAVAAEETTVLFLNIGRLFDTPGAPGVWHPAFMTRLLQMSARKNLVLSGRTFHTTPKSARERIMSYLNAESLRHDGAISFNIPFNRQDMADYLNLERTALSKELGKMRKDGLIDYRKNHFVLYGD